MPRIAGADKTLLLIVDFQNGVVASARNREAVAANLNALARKARAKGVPVAWVQHSDAELVPGTREWELAGELEADPKDLRIGKTCQSSFEATDLDETLGKLKVSRLVLAGAQTNWCIRATAYGALERGYDLTLIADAHTTDDVELGNGRRLEAEHLILDLNIAMAHLRYPGRTNRCVKTADFDF